MTYTTLREALYDFFTHNAPLVSDGGYYSSEDVFTALPYAKGRRYFDAVALSTDSFFIGIRNILTNLQCFGPEIGENGRSFARGLRRKSAQRG